MQLGIELTRAASIERQYIRNFRRKYRGEDQMLVNGDLLYCLALMRYRGAPTRLLDFSYSPYVGARFAIGQGAKTGVVWGINCEWCIEAVRNIVGYDLVRQRNNDKTRNDSSFEPMYFKPSAEKFVHPENPLHHERLTIQQEIFLCPGDIRIPFEQYLAALNGSDQPKNIVKLCFQLDKQSAREFARRLLRMNIDSAALFPGVDGFSRALAERAFLYDEL